ncbi:hypothetical protein K2Y11_13865 [bacterium]|nr:hypothetical protein [bacterium]
MLGLLVLFVALGAPPDSPAVEAALPAVERNDFKLQVIQIPDENLIAQIRMYLSGEAQPLSLEEFSNLLQRYREFQKRKNERLPTRAQLNATVNVISSRLVGTAHWEFPKGDTSRLSIRPWNLAIKDLRFSDEPVNAPGKAAWGADGDSGLAVFGASTEPVQVDMKWELQGTLIDGEIHFNVRIPATVMSHLDVDVPSGWNLRAETTTITLELTPNKHRIYPSTTGAIDFVLTRTSEVTPSFGNFVYRNQSRCRFQDRDVLFRSEVFVDVIRGPVGTITLEVNSPYGNLKPSTSINGDWSMENLQGGGARWIFTSSSIPIGPVRLVLEGTLPLQGAEPWTPPLIHVLGGTLLSEEISFLVPPQLRVIGLKAGAYTFVTAGIETDNTYQIAFRGAGIGDRPALTLGFVEPRLESTTQMLLDLRSDPIRATGVVEIHVESGSVHQLEASLPKGWRFLSVDSDPERIVDGVRSEPNEDGSTAVQMTLASGPSPITKFTLKIAAELEESVDGITSERLLNLPEINLVGVRPSGVSTYDIYLDSNVPCNLDSLPPSKPISAEGGTRDVYSFSYISPLSTAKIILLPAAPRFRGTLTQNTRWRGKDWREELTLDIAVLQGSLETLHVVSSQPFPTDISWKVVGADNSVIRFEPFPGAGIANQAIRPEPGMDQAPEDAEVPPDAPTEFNYLLRTALPVRGNLRLTTSWTTQEPKIRLPLLQLPDADAFNASVEVASRTGRVIDVLSHGLVPTDPSRVDSSTREESGLVWMANYDRLEPGASLSLAVMRGDTAESDILANRCFMRCRTLIEQSATVHVVELTLENNRTQPLRLHLPKDSYIWQLDLDGVSISPGSQDGVLEASTELAPGSHDCRIVFSSPLPQWIGIARIEFPNLVPDWETVCALWKINRSSAAYLFPGDSLIQHSELLFLGTLPKSRIVDLTRTQDSLQTVQLMTEAFRAISDRTEKSAGEVLSELSRSVMPSGQVVIDSSSFLRQQVRHQPDETLAEWLEVEELVAVISDRSVVFTSRVPPFLSRNIRQNWNLDTWQSELISESRVQGMDRSGRFLAPGVNRFSQFDDIPLSNQSSPQIHSGVSWALASRGGGNATKCYVTVVPAELLTRVSRFMVFAGMAIILIVGRGLSTASHRLLLLVLLSCSLVAACMGGVMHHLFSIPLWAMIASSVLVLVLRIWGGTLLGTTKATTAAILLLVVVSPARTEPPQRDALVEVPERILIPVGPDGKMERVIVPESLVKRLESIPASQPESLIIRRGQYEGQVSDSGRCEWHVTMMAFLGSSSSSTLPVSLPFGGIEPTRLSVDGNAVPFRRPGTNVGLDFNIAGLPEDKIQAGVPRSVRIELDFTTPLTGTADERAVSFLIPAAAETEVRLWSSADRIELDASSAADGWQELTIDGKQGVSLIAGPTTRINLHWRTGKGPEATVDPSNLESIRLMSIGEQGGELTYSFRWAAEVGKREVVFVVPSPLVIRKVEGDRVKSWRVEPISPESANSRLLVELDTAKRSPLVLFVRGEVPINASSRMQLPDLHLEGTFEETGVLGIRSASGWQMELDKSEHAESAPLAEFVAAWSRTFQDQVPSGIGLVHRYGPRKLDDPIRVSFFARPPHSRWRVDQNLTVELDPQAGLTTMDIAAALHVVGHPSAQIAIDIPEGIEVLKISGPDLFNWFVQNKQIILLFRAPVTTETTVSLSTRSIWSGRGKLPMTRTGVSLMPLSWQQAESLTNQWQIRSAVGWRVAATPNSQEPEGVQGPLLSLRTEGDKVVTVSLIPQERELAADSLITVTVRDRETIIEGKFIISVKKGAVDELEFRTPAGLTNLFWDIENLPSPESSLQGDERVWRLRSARSIVGNLTVRWRTSKFYDTDTVSIPHVVLRTKASVREWITISNLTDRTLTPQYTGLTPAELPESLLSNPQNGASSVQRARQSFLAERADWRLSFDLAERPKNIAPFNVLWCEGDTIEMPDGQIRGLMIWQIIDESDGVIEVRLAESARIDRLQIDGDPLPLPDVSPGKIRVPVYRKGRRQRLSLQWSVPKPEATEQIPIPRLDTTSEYPTILRFRHSSSKEFRVIADSVDRVHWLVTRFEHAVDEISHRMEKPNNPVEREELAILVARARALQQELEPALQAAAIIEYEPDGSSVVVDHPDATQGLNLIRQFGDMLVKMPSEWSQGNFGEVDRLLSIWREIEVLPADQVEYVSSASLPDSVSLSPRSVWKLRTVTTNEWVRIGTAAITLLIVLNRRLWSSMQLYWPAPMLAAGIAWAKFADTYVIGWILVAVAIAGLVWNIRRWFWDDSNETPSTIIRGSTRLHRTTAATDSNIT